MYRYLCVGLFLCWRNSLWRAYSQKYSFGASLIPINMNSTDIHMTCSIEVHSHKFWPDWHSSKIYLRIMFPLDVSILRRQFLLWRVKLVHCVHFWFSASHINDCQMIFAWSQSNHFITFPVSAVRLFNYQLNTFGSLKRSVFYVLAFQSERVSGSFY